MPPLRDELRQRNLERFEQLVGRRLAISRHLRGEDGRLDADFSDRVAFTEMDEVLEQLDNDGRAEVAQIKAMLMRLEDGAWQECVSCGTTIPDGRLLALPSTAVCVDCAD